MTSLLLALLSFFYLDKYYPAYGALIVLAVALYAAVEFRALRLREHWRNLTRYALAAFVVFALVVAPTLLEIFSRHASAPYQHIHDGALQTEAALQFLLAGKIPFGQNYAATVVGNWEHFVIDPALNPTLHHYLYLPMTFLLPLPFYALTQAAVGWFDIRFVLIAAFALLWLILPQLTSRWDDKLALLIAFGLNPFFAPFFIEGRNDVLVLLALAATLLAMQKKRNGLAALALALACATKATAWLAAPFFFAQLWLGDSTRKSFARAALVFAATFGIVMIPFLVWDFRAVVEDTLILGANTNYIWGYGLSMLLLAAGVIPDRLSPFPFWILQLAFGIPTMLALFRFQARAAQSGVAGRPRAMLIAAAIFAFVFIFFSRHLADSYLGYIVALGAIGYYSSENA